MIWKLGDLAEFKGTSLWDQKFRQIPYLVSVHDRGAYLLFVQDRGGRGSEGTFG